MDKDELAQLFDTSDLQFVLWSELVEDITVSDDDYFTLKVTFHGADGTVGLAYEGGPVVKGPQFFSDGDVIKFTQIPYCPSRRLIIASSAYADILVTPQRSMFSADSPDIEAPAEINFSNKQDLNISTGFILALILGWVLLKGLK